MEKAKTLTIIADNNKNNKNKDEFLTKKCENKPKTQYLAKIRRKIGIVNLACSKKSRLERL